MHQSPIRLHVLTRPHTPIALAFRVRLGSHHDPVGKEGLAHLVEHLLLTGSPSFPTKSQAMTKLELVGARCFASTGFDDIGIFMHVAQSNDLPLALTVLRAFLAETIITEEQLEKEKDIIRSEWRRKQSRPSARAHDAVHELLYHGTRLEHPILGYPHTLDAISLNDVQSYQAQLLRSEATFSVVGDTSYAEITPHIASFPFELSVPTLVPSFTSSHPKKALHLTHTGSQEAYLALGARTVAVGHGDEASYEVLAHLLGHGRASLCTQVLREDLGVVYNVTAQHYPGAHTGELMIETSAKDSDIIGVKDHILRIIRELPHRPDLEHLVHQTTATMLRTEVLDRETTYAQMMFLSDRWTFGVSTTQEAYSTSIKNVTAHDIKRITTALASTEAWSYALIRPE
jgi:predicted Zn-dependent peptidase